MNEYVEINMKVGLHVFPRSLAVKKEITITMLWGKITATLFFPISSDCPAECAENLLNILQLANFNNICYGGLVSWLASWFK